MLKSELPSILSTTENRLKRNNPYLCPKYRIYSYFCVQIKNTLSFMVLNYIWIAFFLTAFVVALIRLVFLGDTQVFHVQFL